MKYILVTLFVCSFSHITAAGELVVKSVHSFHLDRIREPGPRGISVNIKTLEPEYHWLVVIYEAEGKFSSEDTKRISIKAREGIHLSSASHERFYPVGRYLMDGIMRGSVRNVNLRYRASNPTPKVKEGIVYAVPKDVKEFDFTLGNHSSLLKNIPNGNVPKVSEFADFEIKEAVFISELPYERVKDRIGQDLRATVTTNYELIGGKCLRFILKVKPKNMNNIEREEYYLSTDQLSILTNAGAVSNLWQHAESIESTSLHWRGSVSLRKVDGHLSETDLVCYFIVPADSKSFELYYLNEKIAKNDVKN